MLSTRRARLLLALVLSISTLAILAREIAGQATRTAGATLFEGARLITGDGSPPIENSAFLVENNRFARIGRKGELQLPSGAARVDLTGKTVMPAIIELHTHVGYLNLRSSGPVDEFSRENLVDHLRRYAYYGAAVVTSLGLDVGDVPFHVRQEQIPDAALFFTAGRGLASPNTGPSGGARSKAPYTVTNEAEARQAVRELAGKKVDFVKIWVDDRGGKFEKLSPALYNAIIDEAHKHKLRVVAHIFALEDAKALLRAGIDGFAHGVRGMEIDEELIALFKKRPEVFVIPNLPDRGVPEDPAWLRGTVSPAEIARMREAAAALKPGAVQATRDLFGIQARNLARLSKAGVRIGFGTDGTGAGWPVHVEIADMVAAGMTPAQVITAATRTSAEILRLDKLGTVAAGKSAGFIVLDVNPLDDITNTRRISRVYLRGQQVDREALRSSWGTALRAVQPVAETNRTAR